MSGLFRPYGPVGEFTPSGSLIDVSELGNVPVAPKTIIKADPGGGGGWTVGVLQPDEVGANGVAPLDANGRALLSTTPSRVVNVLTTGLTSGGNLSINANPTLFDLAAGTGIIVDNHTDPAAPLIGELSWPAQTGISAQYVGTDGFTVVLINAAGSVIQQTSFPTQSQLRTHIVLGTLIHTGGVLTGVVMRPIVSFNTVLDVIDFVRTFGAINVSGNIFSANGATLQLSKTAGQMFHLGANYANDRTRPSVPDQAAAAPVTFNYIYRNGLGTFVSTAPTNTVNPNLWDDGSGVLQSVPAGKFTIQSIYLAPDGSVQLYYGQKLYDTLAEARGSTTTAVEVMSNPDFALRGWVVVAQGATDLSDPLQAAIATAGRLGLTDVGGGSIVGEVNDGANVGTGGVGPYKGKSGHTLEFRNITAASNKVSVALDGANDEIDIDVVPGNVSHQDLLGAGTNTHADIDDHIGNAVIDPHPQYQRKDERGAANGYAALDGAGDVPRTQLPDEIAYEDENNIFTQVNDFTGTLRVPRKATPGSPAVGEIYIDGIDLKFRDNQPSPADQTVERLSNKGQPGGYPSLDGSIKVVQDPANATGTPTAGKIPFADANGRLDGWVTGDHAPQHNFLTTNVTTTSTAFVPLFSFIRATEGPNTKLVILVAIGFSNSANDRTVSFQLRVNGTPVRATGMRVNGADAPANVGLVYKTGALTAGNQTIEIWWKTSSSTAQVRPLSAPDATEFLDVLTWETN